MTWAPPTDVPPQEHGGDVRKARTRFGRDEFLDFSASINPSGTPPGLREHLLSAWEQVLEYPEPHSGSLVEALASRFGVRPGQVLVGNGSAELIDLLLRSRPWQRLLLSPPDFGLYGALCPPGIVLEWVSRREEADFAPDLDALADRAQGGDLLFLSNPSNPAGYAAERGRILALAQRCAAVGATLALDEAFADFCPEVSLLGNAGRIPGLVILRSLTKFYALPGLRAGFLAGEEGLVSAAGRLQVPWSVNALAQSAGIFSLRQGEWEERSRRYVEVERERLRTSLARLPGLSPLRSRANYLLVRLAPPAPRATDLYETLASRGFLIRHCASFGLGEEYVRIAVRTRPENERLLGALRHALGCVEPLASAPPRDSVLATG